MSPLWRGLFCVVIVLFLLLTAQDFAAHRWMSATIGVVLTAILLFIVTDRKIGG